MSFCMMRVILGYDVLSLSLSICLLVHLPQGEGGNAVCGESRTFPQPSRAIRLRRDAALVGF